MTLSKQNRSTKGCSKLKRSVDITSSGKNGLNIRTMQVPNRTGPGVRRSKRSLLASRTRCNVLWQSSFVFCLLQKLCLPILTNSLPIWDFFRQVRHCVVIFTGTPIKLHLSWRVYMYNHTFCWTQPKVKPLFEVYFVHYLFISWTVCGFNYLFGMSLICKMSYYDKELHC